MILEIGNLGAINIANRWIVASGTHHVDVSNYFLRKLRDQGILVMKHIPGDTNNSNLFRKNVDGFDCHIPLYVRHSKYVTKKIKLQVGRFLGDNMHLNLELRFLITPTMEISIRIMRKTW